MKKFMDEDFLLQNDTAKRLYHQAAETTPILDYHNHLEPQVIYEDRCYPDIAEVWLGRDHYKWRAMRADGIGEDKITGKASGREKFDAWCAVMPDLIGNPLYHWTHLELKRYFGMDTIICSENADQIWEQTNAMLNTPEYSVRNLLRKMNVKTLCTTDDPLDDLRWHKLLKADFEIRVLPAFRPDPVLNIEKEGYLEYLGKLAELTGEDCGSWEGLKAALKKRMDHFAEQGCKLSDHALNGDFYAPADEAQIQKLLDQKKAGQPLTISQLRQYRGAVLVFLASEYVKRGWAMQLHIGALRNNNSRMFAKLGADTGYDSTDDPMIAGQLNSLLDAMEQNAGVPKLILYSLNSKDYEVLATAAGNFQDGSLPGKIQLGSAWWFCDQKRGMEKQLDTLAEVGLLSRFVGMLTDSRSFLSFPRHEYFRRILCNKLGTWVENGEAPQDWMQLEKMVRDICYDNAVRYFEF